MTENNGLVVTELKKQGLESSMEILYGFKTGGDKPAADVQDGIKKIKKWGKDLGLDSSLLQAVPTCLAKQQADRGSFDLVVMSQIEAEFQRFVEKFTDELASGEPGKKERADKVEVAGSEHAQALAAEEATKAAKEAACTAQGDAETEHKALLKAQQQGAMDRGIATAAVQASKDQLQEFDEGPLAAFKELLELTEIPPPAPAPVEPDVGTAGNDIAQPPVEPDVGTAGNDIAQPSVEPDVGTAGNDIAQPSVETDVGTVGDDIAQP